MTTADERSLEARVEEARNLLGLPEDVSFAEIQRAYREKSRQVHPDHQELTNRQEATAHMQQINAAYALLRELVLNLRISLRPQDVRKQFFDARTWWEERFGGAFWEE